MKKSIHPTFKDTNVVCSCGNKFVVTSNREELQIELCDKCHPFYTGNQSSASKTGRIDKFNRKYGLTDEKQAK